MDFWGMVLTVDSVANVKKKNKTKEVFVLT